MRNYVTGATLAEKAAQWIAEVEPYNRNREISMGQVALIIVDMQNYFLNPSSTAHIPAAEVILPNIVRLISWARHRSIPVIYTRHAHERSAVNDPMLQFWRDLCYEGTPESELTQALSPAPNEVTLTKSAYSAFRGTDLDDRLRTAGIEEIIIGGVMTNLCCETTARDAFQNGYGVHIPSDATAATTEALHLGSLRALAYGFATITQVTEIIESATG